MATRNDQQAWTREELDILSREWPNGGMKRVAPLLPGRSVSAIRGKKEALGLRVNGGTYRRQELTEWIEAQLRREYLKPAPDIRGLARRLDRTVGWLKYQGRKLGIAKRTYNAPWLPEEDAFLEAKLEKGVALNTIYKHMRAAGYVRTLNAISSRVGILGLGFHRNYWSAHDVATAMGIEIHSVSRWIQAGLLKAKRTAGPSCPAPNDMPDAKKMWAVKPGDLRAFMLAHPCQWDHKRIQKEVLLDLLMGGHYGLNGGAFSAGRAA